MPKPSIKGALSHSVAAEEKKFQDKFAKADAHMEPAAGESKHETSSPSQIEPVVKVVREAFTIPATEHAHIEAMQKFMLQNAVAVSKSEVVRAGLLLLSQADDAARLEVFEQLERVKTGRPKAV